MVTSRLKTASQGREGGRKEGRKGMERYGGEGMADRFEYQACIIASVSSRLTTKSRSIFHVL